MIKAIPLKRESILSLGLLVCLGILAPLLFKQQLVTGTIVNATIIGASLSFGLAGGLLAGVLPSSIALLCGVLPAPLVPMIPFIIAGNAVLALVVASHRTRNYWASTAAGAVLKFALLYASSAVVITRLLHQSIPPSIVHMMAWPQLVTAVMGAMVAFAVSRLLRTPER
jgi:hypothetical protein